jgi:hypothetical protein
MRQKCWFILSTCFGHKYAHRQEHNSEFRFLVYKPGKSSGLCGAGLLDVCTVQGMWPNGQQAVTHNNINVHTASIVTNLTQHSPLPYFILPIGVLLTG